MTVHLDGPGVTISDVVAVARQAESVELTPAAVERMAAARAVVEQLAEGEPKYGISTGFGALATVSIAPDRRRALQVTLIRSHAAGLGDPVEDEVVRAMVLFRARTLALGYSGARPLVAQAMVDILNAGITPIVPEYGSLGASGDLAPLAHGALALLGEGDVVHRGHVRPAADALGDAGLLPIELAEKEGLAVTNGTDGILGMLCLAIADIERLLAQADMITAMTVEGLLATDTPFAAELQALRPQPGQAITAANLRAMLADSPIVASHAHDGDVRVQDAYSIRCTPSVHGAVRDTLEHCRFVATNELASAIDNPMVLADGRVESCGNFHGAPLGFAADFLAIAVSEIGAIAERRMDRMLDKTRSQGLPPFLAEEVGVDSGLMIGHYTAAAMASENKRLAAPASVDSLPTSGMQEDHVSMAWLAVRKLRKVIDNVRRILAVEYVCAARAIEFRRAARPPHRRRAPWWRCSAPTSKVSDPTVSSRPNSVQPKHCSTPTQWRRHSCRSVSRWSEGADLRLIAAGFVAADANSPATTPARLGYRDRSPRHPFEHHALLLELGRHGDVLSRCDRTRVRRSRTTGWSSSNCTTTRTSASPTPTGHRSIPTTVPASRSAGRSTTSTQCSLASPCTTLWFRHPPADGERSPCSCTTPRATASKCGKRSADRCPSRRHSST